MKYPYAFLLVSALLVLGIIPAGAASNRTWVSGLTGADTGTCPITAPCASFQYALGQTASGGEIDCFGPGDFSNNGVGVTISQSVSIICDGVSNGGMLITTAGNAAVTINAPSGAVVTLSGLNLNGLGGTGRYGVYVEAGSTVYVVHSTVRGFSNTGVFVGSSTNPTRVLIKDSLIATNGFGVAVGGTPSQDGATNVAIIVNSVIDGNTNIAAEANGAFGPSVISLTRTVLSGSPTGLDLVAGASADLVGPSNTIAGAISGPTTSVPFK